MSALDLNKINKTISDRSNVFYWQTDRDISPEEISLIWSDRHSAISNDELFQKVNKFLDNEVFMKHFLIRYEHH